MKTSKEVFEWVKKFASAAEKERYRVLWLEMDAMRKRIKNLEFMNDKHMAPQMFKDPPTPKEMAVIASIEATRQLCKSMENHNGVPLKTRLKQLIEDKKVDTKEWALALKWNNLTEEMAYKLAEEA